MKVFIVSFLCFIALSNDVSGSAQTRVRRFTQMDAIRETRFWLFTRQNREYGQPLRDADPISVSDSYFNSDWPTRILIHGFASKKNSTFNRAIKNAYLDKGDFNVIVVDWSKLAGSKKTVYNYPTIADSVQHIGLLVGSFAQFLWNDFNVPFDNMYLIGHSLGAHIAGFAADYVRPEKFNTIFALDPAGPRFDPHKRAETIDSEDAIYVESIQTNLGIRGTLNLGQSQNIGKAAFYPNFGDNQPGCSIPTCSHSRAYRIFAESINKDIVAKKCSDLSEIFGRDCTSGEPLVYIGGEPSRKDREGVFYLKTNSREPFSTNEYAKAEHLVSFWYYSKNSVKGFNLAEAATALSEANFSRHLPTRIIICDYASTSSTAFASCQGIREAYFAKGDYNIIQVDWSIAVSSGVFRKDVFTDDIGNITAQITLIVRDVFHVPLSNVYIIGAGTGAQIAHYSAKRIVPDKYDTFFILDYDRPLPMDGAAYLEAIQTSSNTWHAGATFFPNRGGKKNCNKYECRHELAYQFFKDSITGTAFNGNECLGIRGTEQNVCIRRVGEKTYKMGGDPSTHKESGPYYRSTKLD